jgi:iron complex transport system ATP-binding protein
MSRSPAVLSLEDIAFRREGVEVLRGVTWRVSAGEHWAMLGPNGSGKTTLMMIAAGYLPSSGGRTFLVDGYISEIVLPQVREKVGVVSAALSEAMVRNFGATTGLRVVLSGRYGSLGLYRRPEPEVLEEAQRVMERFDITSLAEAQFGAMSTGQRQICLIARSQMARSALVILDEPCAGLDLARREHLLAAIDESCRLAPHVPQIIITHHAQEIVASVSHVLLLRQGRVVAQGLKDEVLSEASLEATYGLPLRIIREHGRVWVIPR